MHLHQTDADALRGPETRGLVVVDFDPLGGGGIQSVMQLLSAVIGIKAPAAESRLKRA